jgi:hypothetical protein
MRLINDEDLDSAQLLDVGDFIGMVEDGTIEDSDGYAHLVYDFEEFDPKRELSATDIIEMSIPTGVSHILWHQD